VAVLFQKPGKRRRGLILEFLCSRRLWVSVLALLFLGSLLMGGRWAYGKWTNRQSWSLASLAETQLREGRVNEALMSLETALRLRPDHPHALRLLAQAHTASGQRQQALAAWQKLSESAQLTAADAAAYGLLAGVEGEWALADRIIDSFSIGNQGAEADLLRANILSLRGDTDGTEASLRQAVAKDSTPRSRAALAGFLLAHRLNSSTAPEILTLHRNLITLPDETGANALAAALEAQIVPAAERATWIDTLRKHPKATPALLLEADSAEAAADPAATPLLAAKVSARLEKAPVAERRLGFLWLARHNQHARALRLVTVDETLADPTLFAAWIEALADTGQLEQILQTLDLPANPLPPQRTALYRARTLKLLGRPAEADTAYQSALAALAASANSTTDTLAALAYIQDAGETALFETEVQKLLADPATARTAYESLVPVVAKRRDIASIRRLHELALASPALPQKFSIQNEIDYCDLILARPVDAASIAEIARLNPDNPRFQITQALSLFRAGEFAEALSELTLQGTPPDDPAIQARHAAIQALLLTTTADPVAAAKTLAALDPMRLTAQEAALVQSARPTPQAKATLVERAKTSPADTRLQTAALLARQRDFAAALELVPLDEAIKNQELLLLWLDANGAIGRWDQTLAALARPDNPLPSHTTYLFTALAHKKLGHPEKSRAAFDSALAESGDDPKKLPATLAAILNAGEPALFAENLEKLKDRPDLARAALPVLLPAIQAQRDSALTLRFYELTAISLPDLFQLPATQNDLAYLHLILGRSTPLEPLIQRAAAAPGNLSFLSTLALARLQAGDPAAALASFAEFRPESDFQSLPPRIKAIYAATLAANGQKAPATRIAASIPPESLSLQEGKWLEARIP
jgi:hypothetical protein